MFAGNIFLLIGLFLAVAVAVGLIVAVWTGIKICWWKRDERRAQAAYREARYAPDGTRLPRASRGICEACGAASDAVLHLPDGTRLCRQHYLERCTPKPAVTAAQRAGEA